MMRRTLPLSVCDTTSSRPGLETPNVWQRPSVDPTRIASHDPSTLGRIGSTIAQNCITRRALTGSPPMPTEVIAEGGCLSRGDSTCSGCWAFPRAATLPGLLCSTTGDLSRGVECLAAPLDLTPQPHPMRDSSSTSRPFSRLVRHPSSNKRASHQVRAWRHRSVELSRAVLAKSS